MFSHPFFLLPHLLLHSSDRFDDDFWRGLWVHGSLADTQATFLELPPATAWARLVSSDLQCHHRILIGKQKANLYYTRMDEGRKRVLLIAASILAARKLAQYDKPCPAIEATIANSISMAEKIMRKIDAMFPARQ